MLSSIVGWVQHLGALGRSPRDLQYFAGAASSRTAKLAAEGLPYGSGGADGDENGPGGARRRRRTSRPVRTAGPEPQSGKAGGGEPQGLPGLGLVGQAARRITLSYVAARGSTPEGLRWLAAAT